MTLQTANETDSTGYPITKQAQGLEREKAKKTASATKDCG